MLKVDLRRLRLEGGQSTLGLIGALAECLELGSGVLAQSEAVWCQKKIGHRGQLSVLWGIMRVLKRFQGRGVANPRSSDPPSSAVGSRSSFSGYQLPLTAPLSPPYCYLFHQCSSRHAAPIPQRLIGCRREADIRWKGAVMRDSRQKKVWPPGRVAARMTGYLRSEDLVPVNGCGRHGDERWGVCW